MIPATSTAASSWKQRWRLREETSGRGTWAAFRGPAVDPQRWFCVDDLCPAFVGSTPVFADGVHMTAEYSERIGDSVAAALLET